ncbi:MAG: hypothetical protein JSW43_10010 [Gemmatimonadota bacterium]|nr:MAG: hypothetical protein JSW43_10010 [Gemmatimonadota bacterium]
MRLFCSLVTLLLLAPAAAAQEFERPADWKVRLDRADASDLYFVAMPPGWHITTGPAGIFYDPARTATGAYRLRAEVHLFPGERREGVGVFFGGRQLEGADQAYAYFLIRKDGRFLVKTRRGSETEVVVPWTEHTAILPHDGGEDPVKNVLAVEVGSEEVQFYVNGERVTSVPRSELDCDGVVGLRVNHALNVHVSTLVVEQPSG